MTAARGQTPEAPPATALRVQTADDRAFRFTQPFHVGREHDCEVRLEDVHVSRRHVLVTCDGGVWRFRDLQSANGVFIDGRRVQAGPIGEGLTMTLGIDGPALSLAPDPQPQTHRRLGHPLQTVRNSVRETVLLARYAERYFGSDAGQGHVGGRTLMIRKAFQNIQRKQKRKYTLVVAVLALASICAAGYAYYQHRQMRQQRAMAEELFYAMKALDVNIANVERLVAASGNAQAREQVIRNLARRRQMENAYDRFLSALNLYDQQLTEEDRLILRVTRLFGECELAAPPEYMSQIKSYIRRWQSSDRYANGIKLAEQMGYTETIVAEFLSQNLPPQFFYLAMQESNFDAFTSGPPTRMGIAKGMWQFIPETAARYGLTIGPLATLRRPDPRDDRHNWRKATQAAARYIKDIYATDAQASGLLVVASYNWGENRVINLLRSMPANPQERNLWKVLEKHHDRVPKETYDYVFYIVSAAVIGENPRLFGFPFDNPLGLQETQRPSRQGR
jgi:hypothetical protein